MNNLEMEWYISQIREKLKLRLTDINFVGNVKFEVNIKDGGIVNMNFDQRESLRKP